MSRAKLILSLIALSIAIFIGQTWAQSPPAPDPLASGYYIFDPEEDNNGPWGGVFGYVYNGALVDNGPPAIPDPNGREVYDEDEGIAELKNVRTGDGYWGAFIGFNDFEPGTYPSPSNCKNGISYYYKSTHAHTFIMEFPASYCPEPDPGYGYQWKTTTLIPSSDGSWIQRTITFDDLGAPDADECGAVPHDLDIVSQISWGFEGNPDASNASRGNLAIANVACLSPSYDVTFDVDGGSSVGNQNVNLGATATKPSNPTKAGFKFLGWFIEDTEFNFSTPITEAIELTAKWGSNEDYAEVTFDSDGGSDVESKIVEKGLTVTEPSNPTKPGFVFTGWFEDGETDPFDFDTPITEDLTLTASWAEAHTVTFNSDGGSEVQNQNVLNGDKAAEPSNPTKTGYAFTGWFEDGATDPFDFDTPITEGLTLTARWAINTYTVTFNSDGGSTVDNQTINHGSLATGPIDPTKAGFIFAGWFNGTVQFNFSTPVTSNLTLTARWTAVVPIISVAPNASMLNARMQNGTLHLSGLSAGKAWSVYSINGTLVHQSTAGSTEASVKLNAAGVYFVKSGGQTLKLVNR